jgi:adenine/guanine phosphoribosyltransferase-like PRPP-binding protein
LARAAAQGVTIAAGGFLFAVAVVALLDVEVACVDRRWLLFS